MGQQNVTYHRSPEKLRTGYDFSLSQEWLATDRSECFEPLSKRSFQRKPIWRTETCGIGRHIVIVSSNSNKLHFTCYLHIFIAFERQIPPVQNEVIQQHLDNTLTRQQLTAEDVRQNTAVVVKVDRQQFALF